jgi:hypothetical protein
LSCTSDVYKNKAIKFLDVLKTHNYEKIASQVSIKFDSSGTFSLRNQADVCYRIISEFPFPPDSMIKKGESELLNSYKYEFIYSDPKFNDRKIFAEIDVLISKYDKTITHFNGSYGDYGAINKDLKNLNFK